jgi:hypothetical protein
MTNIDYVEARAGILAKMQKQYVNDYVTTGAFDVQETIIAEDKLSKIKLGFKELGGKFSNGVRKIKSLYVHYEIVGKRHLH